MTIFTIKIYGIKNCDSCKKALKLIATSAYDHEFIDVRDHPVSQAQLTQWCKQLGIGQLINKRSTTWRTLAQDNRKIAHVSQAVKLIQQYPTLMKRPVIEFGDQLILGFNAPELTELLKK